MSPSSSSLLKLDTYLNLCTQVYDLSKPKAPEDAYAFYRSYVEKANGLVLEPMCGTGRFLLPLIEEGFKIHGFDASDHMVDALFEKAKLKSLKPTVWKGFVEDFNRTEKYNLIFIPTGSFGLITDMTAVRLALTKFCQLLSDDGVFLFEMDTFSSIPSLNVWRGSVWYKPDNNMILLSQLALFENGIVNSIGKYELVSNNSVIKTEIEQLKVRIYDTFELTEILKSCGFNQVRCLKAFDSNAVPNENDEIIVYECKKQPEMLIS